MRRDRSSVSPRFGLLISTLLALPTLAACESQARQDPIYVQESTDTLVFHNSALSKDRPLDDTLRSSLELADYARGLELTGLITVVQRPGPFTVFAIPNPPLEALRARDPGLLDSARLPSLKQRLAYTIVPGRYPDRTLRAMLNKARGPIGLRTLASAMLTVSVDPASNQLVLSDSFGQRSRIWLSSMPQSNGTLYVTQGMLTPGMQTSGPAPLPSRSGVRVAAR